MTLLVAAGQLAARRAAAQGPLAPLAASLTSDLEPLLDGSVDVPAAKALLSREGGRCARDGTALEFAPLSPHAHRCPACGASHAGERHDRWWAMGAHLWYAERAVHAALLYALGGGEPLRAAAHAILEQYAGRYLEYPNRDNVLGPSRPFFSTYLEAIWLLQLCAALDLLELAGDAGAVGDRVRDRVVEPSSALIASYSEGLSNRQVWNGAALLAAARLLCRHEQAERLVLGPGGLAWLLEHALLADGTWYEGENYHQFAHRGLWYGVSMAACAGIPIAAALVRRFDEGFAAPLATAFPDLTLPARRDSRYGASLRQWRWAESFELGLARREDARLASALHALYTWNGPRRDTGRDRSTAEAERDAPPSALTRADLGWRSLLFALPELPPSRPLPATSVLLPAQGIAVLRRAGGRVYAALDYGHSGGGHGHPDRLDVLLAVGATRVLDDMGTGSYVEPSLHWYRSTLAHNAPLLQGRSQLRVAGRLLAYEELAGAQRDDRGDVQGDAQGDARAVARLKKPGGAGWVSAELPADALAPGVRITRALVMLGDYAVDHLAWTAVEPVQVDLPVHVASPPGLTEWRRAPLAGGDDVEDGFAWVMDSEVAEHTGSVRIEVPVDDAGAGAAVRAWLLPRVHTEWWRAVAPGPPGAGPRPFLLARQRGTVGGVTSVWCWDGAVRDARLEHGALAVLLEGRERHDHSPGEREWRITRHRGPARGDVRLAGAFGASGAAAPGAARDASDGAPAKDAQGIVWLCPGTTWRVTLAGAHYRRSELSWKEAGAPTAGISITALPPVLRIGVEVHKADVIFRPPDAPDPALDNEHPDIHSDGVQFHLLLPGQPAPATWLAVPEREGGGRVRLRATGPAQGVPVVAAWTAHAGGYTVTLDVPLSALGGGAGSIVWLTVAVNDMGPGRERRRGQLALGARPGEFVYLRGDREPADAFRPFALAPAGEAPR